MSASSDVDTLDVPGFFVVKNRSGDPSTEDLHARASQAKVRVPLYAFAGEARPAFVEALLVPPRERCEGHGRNADVA